jgi:dCTP deaminase
MILSNNAIKEAVSKGDMLIAPFDENNLKSASYTFTLSPKILVPKKVPLVVINAEQERAEIVMGPDGFILQPGEFVLGFTAEHVALKNRYACFLGARGSCAQAGLSVLLSSNFAEPDTDNSIILEIHNVGSSPIQLKPGMKIVKGIFAQVEGK